MNDLEARRTAVIERLRAGREEFLAAAAEVPRELADAGSSWSPLDVVRHIAWATPKTPGRGGLLYWVDQALGSAPTDIPDTPAWQRWLDGATESIDSVIAFVENIPGEELGRAFRVGERSLTVIDALEAYAGHYHEHGAQIRAISARLASARQ